MAPVRVVQWTTGIVGASALRAILDDNRLELVGVFAHGTAKVGQDAGGLAIDDYDLVVDCAVAVDDRDLGFMRIDAGTVCGVDATWTGSSNGAPIAEMQTIWMLGGLFGARQEPE